MGEQFDYTCAECRRTFTTTRERDVDAHKEARERHGRDGTAPDMVAICDECFERGRREGRW